jgi:hypothetical protein
LDSANDPIESGLASYPVEAVVARLRSRPLPAPPLQSGCGM